MIKLLIVDDHALVREGIKSLLDFYDDIEVVGEAEDGLEAIEMCSKYNPDVVLMDLVMPKVGGLEATGKILKDWPNIKIITLTSFIDKKLIEDSLKAGSMGYVLKNISGENLVSTIRDAYNGKSTLSSEASDVLISNLKTPRLTEYQLTAQEKIIITHLVEGLSNKLIAQKLVLSLSTIK